MYRPRPASRDARGALAQLARALARHARGRRFDSCTPHHPPHATGPSCASPPSGTWPFQARRTPRNRDISRFLRRAARDVPAHALEPVTCHGSWSRHEPRASGRRDEPWNLAVVGQGRSHTHWRARPGPSPLSSPRSAMQAVVAARVAAAPSGRRFMVTKPTANAVGSPATTLTSAEIDDRPRLPLGDAVGVRHTVLWSEGHSSAGQLWFEPNARLPEHTHGRHVHHLWVLDGEVRIDGRTLGPGAYCQVPAGQPHGFEAGASGAAVGYLLPRALRSEAPSGRRRDRCARAAPRCRAPGRDRADRGQRDRRVRAQPSASGCARCDVCARPGRDGRAGRDRPPLRRTEAGRARCDRGAGRLAPEAPARRPPAGDCYT